MQTTSSPTSEVPSSAFRALPFAAWSALAIAFVAGGFLSQSDDSTDTTRILYDYSFAGGTVLIYAVLIGITFLIALAYKGWSAEAIGLRPFSLRWVAIAVGLIILVLILASVLEPVLHGGRDQGLSPTSWEPEHAGAFALNGLVVATVVPFTEELFFRGLGVRALGFLGGIVAVVVTGLVFGL